MFYRHLPCRALLVLVALCWGACSDTTVTDEECGLEYQLPADIPGRLADATQSTFDEYSWQSFLALKIPPRTR